jgi:hypothetical protein
MADDPEHVMDVREAIFGVEDVAKELLGLVEIALRIVLPTKNEELLDALIHGTGDYHGTRGLPRRPL